MKKILDNKLLMMPLILVMTASIAMFAFAPSGIKADPNKGLPFKAVKYCIPKVVQVVIQKIIKGILSKIPYVGALFAAVPDKYYPVPCGCDKNLIDSTISFMDVKDNPFDFLPHFEIPGIGYSPTQSTQKDLEKKLTKDLVPKWEEVQKQQAAMVKKGNPDGLDKFRQAYAGMRQGLINANALSYATNFKDEFEKRFPNMSARVESMSDVEKRIAGGWNKIMDAWMKALNLVGRNFDEEQQIRNQLAYNILKSFDDTVYDLGQTHMLQYLGAIAAQSNGIADRTGAEVLGLMEMALTQMEAEIEYEAAARRNVTEIGKEAAACDMSGCCSYSFGF